MSTVTFPAGVGGDGSTVTDDANGTTGLGLGGHLTRFEPALGQLVAIAADTVTSAEAADTSEDAALASFASAVAEAGTYATSTTSLSIGTGTKSPTIQTGKNFVVGMSVLITDAADATNWMTGDVTAYNSGTGAMTVEVVAVNGSGTKASWKVALTGPALATAKVVVNTYTANDSWTKPAGALWVQVEMLGGGGGGGSGRRGPTTAIRGGGGGGAGGAHGRWMFPAASLGSPITVTVGAGGASQVGAVSDNTNGNAGNDGGVSSFGTWAAVVGGSKGGGGTSTTGGGGGGQARGLPQAWGSAIAGTSEGGAGTSGNAGLAFANALSYSSFGGAGGSGGSGAQASSTADFDGYAGGSVVSNATYGGHPLSIAGGAGGIASSSTPPVAGGSAPANVTMGGAGGGGAYYKTAVIGCAGADGGTYGGGGGGGSASDNGYNSGASGAGKAGIVIVTTWK